MYIDLIVFFGLPVHATKLSGTSSSFTLNAFIISIKLNMNETDPAMVPKITTA